MAHPRERYVWPALVAVPVAAVVVVLWPKIAPPWVETQRWIALGLLALAIGLAMIGSWRVFAHRSDRKIIVSAFGGVALLWSSCGYAIARPSLRGYHGVSLELEDGRTLYVIERGFGGKGGGSYSTIYIDEHQWPRLSAVGSCPSGVSRWHLENLVRDPRRSGCTPSVGSVHPSRFSGDYPK